MLWSKRHLGLELLQQHLVAEPVAEKRARFGAARILALRGCEQRAEMKRDRGPPAPPTGLPGPAQPVGSPDVAGDEPGAGLVHEETGAFIDFHERTGAGDLALGKEHQASPVFEALGHALGRVGRVRIDGKGPAVEHDPAMDPTVLGGDVRDDALPIQVQEHVEIEPIEPGDVVRYEEHGARRLEHLGVVGAKTETEPQQETKERAHGEKGWAEGVMNRRRPGPPERRCDSPRERARTAPASHGPGAWAGP